MIPITFIKYAADILGNTNTGLSGSQIAEYCSAYAIDFDLDIPYPEYPFPSELPNKRTALRENLKAFTPEQQYKIIKEFCELEQFKENIDVKDLKIKLISRYSLECTPEAGHKKLECLAGFRYFDTEKESCHGNTTRV